MEKIGLLFLSWQSLILLPKLLVELSVTVGAPSCLYPHPASPRSLSSDSVRSLGRLPSLGKNKPLQINSLIIME